MMEKEALVLGRVARREPAWKDVYRNLRKAILEGGLAERSRLREADLAEAMGVSRTPVREALARLEADGLVRPAERSFVVSDLRVDLVDAYHLRGALEGYAVRLAAERATAEEVARLRANVAISLTVPLEDTATRAQLNDDFHRMLAEASRSPRLIRAFRNHRDLVMSDEDMTVHTVDASRRFLREHDMIVSAIEMRDGDTADRIMRAHLRHAATLLVAGATAHQRQVDEEDGA